MKLTPEQIAERLKSLAGWEYAGGALERRYKFETFMSAIGFVNRAAEIAEADDHHPDITINYTRLRFSCSTHSEGGVTDKDIKLAAAIELAYQKRDG